GKVINNLLPMASTRRFGLARLFRRTAFLLGFGGTFLLAMSGLRGLAQQPSESTNGLSSAEIARIIKVFSTKEVEFRRALNQYSFKRDALVQSLGMGGQITGEYYRI